MTATDSRPDVRGSAAPGTPGGSLLGQWNSAVTSYYVLVGATALLLVIGLVMVLSSSSVESLDDGDSPYAVFLDQAKYALIGLPVLFGLSRMPVRFFQKVAWPALGLAIVFQLMVFVPGLGCGTGGNRNWVCLPGFSAQPSETIKLALAIWLGAVLTRKLTLLREWKHALIPAVPVAGLAIAVVLAGRDLGTALVLIMLVAGALFVAGVPMRMFGLAGIIGGGLAGLLTVTSDNRTDRIKSWLSDECDAASSCYQTLHGGWGLASGGWGGLGLGESREKWSYLPAAHNDFIFAILGEELGLIGTLLVLGLFGLLAFAMIRVIRRHRDPFVQITTGAILCWIIGQALVNIAVVIGLAPVIGIPLPLVSAGGSALIMTMAALGVLIAFARSEPGAAEALAARPGVVRRSLAVIGRSRG
ncbi:putative lipid II flippase FtsW [Cellulomonas fengjieae]|uniref:Probable peptidoglycan glycosyltransferase FtsW n=1 Tax=Cellulomonas fengjieae TaxID=2819978 RepID=A0ABS3SH76_9CELL|nr:putative lipid II flippase FtsW [Cellulomonas fengjieae]MBO3084321.1 putative lipid II flippase FtsW [Cellulomonas fengjieae]MBO3103093.1 putative lipid II flippase FtsW [Cellulomonas fengjieae]QVI67330.1 putative lipid II flippase FtsW [Cellulomonas fengjieae]